MPARTIRIEESVENETVEIASKLGLTFNAVVNILLRKFNAEKGFFFPLALESQKKTVFDMTSKEFEQACRDAVANRSANPTFPYVTTFDENGNLIKKYEDGRVEYVIG